MSEIRKIAVPKFSDERGCLAVLQNDKFFDWEVKRIYWVYNANDKRGKHAVLHEKKVYICLKGKVSGVFHNGKEEFNFELNEGDGVIVDGFWWREFEFFDLDAILLCLSNLNYDEAVYVKSFEEFLKKAKDLNE